MDLKTVNYREIGDADLNKVLPLLRAKNSPMIAEAAAAQAAASPHSAMWWGTTGFENQWGTEGHIIKAEDNNPAAMRPWVGDPTATKTGDVLDWKTRQKVGTIKVPPYADGAVRDSGGGMMLRFPDLASCAREYKRRLSDPAYKNGVYQPATTLWEFLNIYCPPSDNPHPVTGVPNKSILPQYYAVMLDIIGKVRGDGTPQEEPDVSEKQFRAIISAGHRNTDGGGARNEINWTYGASVALKDAIEDHGGFAVILQQVDEWDSDPDWFPGGLQAGARRCVELASKYGPFDVYISMHYNGGASPGFHAIFPDSTGLSPYNAADVKATNPLDVAVCRAIRDEVKKTNTVGILSWTADSPGVMSERETGVGGQGYRLGEFYGTLGFRQRTARVILEAGSIDVRREADYINNPGWVRNTYCEAICRGLAKVFSNFKLNGTPPKPKPEPPQKYPAPVEIPALDKYLSGDVNVIPGEVPFSVGGKDYLAIWVGDTVKVAKAGGTPRLRNLDPASDEVVGDLIPHNEPFDVDWFIIRPGDAKFEPRYRTRWGTIVRVRDTNRIGDDRLY